MSTRTYNLRTHAEATWPQALSQVQNELTPCQFSMLLLHDSPSHISACPSNPTLFCSKFVAFWSPSPIKEASSTTVAHPEGGPEAERLRVGHLQPDAHVVPTISRENILLVERNTSSGVNNSPEESFRVNKEGPYQRANSNCKCCCWNPDQESERNS